MADSSGHGTTDDAVMDAIRSHRAPAVGTADVADVVGVSRQAVDTRLRELQEDGLVDSDKVGTVRIWWLTRAGKRFLEKD